MRDLNRAKTLEDLITYAEFAFSDIIPPSLQAHGTVNTREVRRLMKAVINKAVDLTKPSGDTSVSSRLSDILARVTRVENHLLPLPPAPTPSEIQDLYLP